MPERGERCTSFSFYLYGSHDQLEQRNDGMSALQCSKQRDPGRKGLRDYGAVSCGGLGAAVRFPVELS